MDIMNKDVPVTQYKPRDLVYLISSKLLYLKSLVESLKLFIYDHW